MLATTANQQLIQQCLACRSSSAAFPVLCSPPWLVTVPPAEPDKHTPLYCALLMQPGNDAESSRVNHTFTAEEKRKLNVFESIDYFAPNSSVYRKWLVRQVGKSSGGGQSWPGYARAAVAFSRALAANRTGFRLCSSASYIMLVHANLAPAAARHSH